MRVMGIDPGVTGAVVVVERGRVVEHARMPVRPGPAGRKKVDALKLFDIVRSFGPFDRVVLENPSALPKQGVSSSFGFGRSCGIAEGVVVVFGAPVELVAPSVWKRVMRVPADKGAARARASDLMPADRALWARPSDDGIAEAALIALWGTGEAAADAVAAGAGIDLFGGLHG